MNAGVTLHVETLYGANDHHIAERASRGWRGRCAPRSPSIRARRAKCRRPRERSAVRDPGARNGGRMRRVALRTPPDVATLIRAKESRNAGLHRSRAARDSDDDVLAHTAPSCSCATAFILGVLVRAALDAAASAVAGVIAFC